MGLNGLRAAMLVASTAFCADVLTRVAGAQATASTQQAARLQRLLDSYEYVGYAAAMRNVDAATFTESQRRYYLGMLAFHLGRLKDAEPLLAGAANGNSEHSLTSNQVESAIEAVAQINLRAGRYGAAANDYNVIDSVWGARLGEAGEKSIRENRHLAVLLQHVPQQTCEFTEEFTLRPVGSAASVFGAEYPVSLPGVSSAGPFAAQFDTGAELSVLSATTAKAWGVTLLDGSAMLHGYGGGTFSAQPGVIANLDIGKAHLHHVAVYVAADKDLYIEQIKHQTNALLGYPVVAALGRLSFARDGALTVSPKSPARDPASAPLWMGDHALLVELNTAPVIIGDKITGGGSPRLFVLDTGSGSTYLTDHYLAEHTNVFHGPTPETAKLAGADGVHEIPAYVANPVPLIAGSTVILLKGNHILAQPTEGEMEHFQGVVGEDTLRLFDAYTVDLRNMTLTLTRR